MRILQVNSALSLGGGETHVIELTDELRRRGHDVTVAGRPGSPVNPALELPFWNAADVFTMFRLRRAIVAGRFDIVHAHLARDYTIVAASLQGVTGPRLVLTRHLLYPVRRHFLYRRVDGWLAPTQRMLDSVRSLAARPSAVVPNWVDTSKFAFEPKALRRPVTIGLLGQISPHKGHSDAIDAIRMLGPEGFRLAIAGKGEERYTAELREAAKGLPVEFLGFVLLPDFFGMIDLLVVPSWEEPFGIVLLEAMASGIPVVSTNAGGPAEIIQPGENGWLVPTRDPRALAAAIRAVAGDPATTEQVVHRARRRVEEHYEIRRTVARIEDFYRSLQTEPRRTT